jgi:hypothetical protein
LNVLAQKLSRIGDWGGSNLDANSLQSGSVLDAIQHGILKDPKLDSKAHSTTNRRLKRHRMTTTRR